MTVRLWGAILVFGGCGGMGHAIALAFRREERALQALLEAVEHMICQLRYRLSPLPELCRDAAQQSHGPVQAVLLALSGHLAAQTCPDAGGCMEKALAETPKLPLAVQTQLRYLGATLGQFDAQGQLQGLEGVKEGTQRALSALRSTIGEKTRACRTLALCAGAALAILLI